MKKYILIGLMGTAGALCRYFISMQFSSTLPWGTLMVNILGCLLLPFVFILVRELGHFSDDLVNAMGTGFVGAFTTFSSFSVEIIRRIEGGKISFALFYLLISTSGGLLAAYSSIMISNNVIKKCIRQKAERSH